jgi:hypothetical protein
MGLDTIRVIGPVVIRGNAGECIAGDGCERHFLAADPDSAETLARRHWLIAHPDYEAVTA